MFVGTLWVKHTRWREIWNPPTLVCSRPWKHLRWPLLTELLSTASSSKPLIPLTCTLQKSFMAPASPRPDGCTPQSHSGYGWVLAPTTPYKSYCWERSCIIPRKRLFSVLLYLPVVHARYGEGGYGLCWCQNYPRSIQELQSSSMFPGPNKCSQKDQLGINFFPQWDCSSCVHKTVSRDR